MIFAFVVQVSNSYQIPIVPQHGFASVEKHPFPLVVNPRSLFAITEIVHIIFAANPKAICGVHAFFIASGRIPLRKNSVSQENECEKNNIFHIKPF
jgi:hypothetical protein